MSQKELDAITDKVLAYDPTAKKGPLEVIAGAADSPLVIGDVELPCYVLGQPEPANSPGIRSLFTNVTVSPLFWEDGESAVNRTMKAP